MTDPRGPIRGPATGYVLRAKDVSRRCAVTEPTEYEQTERGAAEEASGTPLTETEVEVSKRPPGVPPKNDGMGLSDDDVE